MDAMDGVTIPSALAGNAPSSERGNAAADWIFSRDAGAVACASDGNASRAAECESEFDAGRIQSAGNAVGECFGNQLDAEPGESACADPSADEHGASHGSAGDGGRQQREKRA